jgi:hypothetical protein
LQQPTDGAGIGDLLSGAANVANLLQLVAYLGALATWAYIAPTLKRLKTAKGNMEGLPPEKQLEVLKLMFGPVPDKISPSQWIRDRRQKLLLIAFIAALIAVVVGLLAYTGQIGGVR